MWMEYNGNPRHLGGFDKATLKTFYDRGFDVWIARQWRSGDNVHEQAAEFAQAVQYAVDYQLSGRGPDGGQVATMGWSLAGLVNRVATARWSWDASWRASLGLQPTVPVRLIIAGEAPLRGAQVNRGLQFLTWKEKKASEANLDTCAAQQMLQRAVHGVCGVYGGGYLCGLGHDDVGWKAFYSQGTGFKFRDRGQNLHSCEGGPPILTQGPNGDGWAPGIKRIAASLGTPRESNRCYGDATGNDLNGSYRDVCPERDAWVPRAGDLWLHIKITTALGDGAKRDVRLGLDSEDLEAGGRHDSIVNVHEKRRGGWFHAIHYSADSHQFASGTFIPLRSALDTTCTGCASAMSDTWVHGYNATHTAVSSRRGSYNMSVVDWLRTHLEGRTPACQPSAEICGNGVDDDCDGRDTPCKGGPFVYATARDQYLACWGMAGHIASNCDTISDFNDKQFCYGMASNSQDPCRSMTDRNLQLSVLRHDVGAELSLELPRHQRSDAAGFLLLGLERGRLGELQRRIGPGDQRPVRGLDLAQQRLLRHHCRRQRSLVLQRALQPDELLLRQHRILRPESAAKLPRPGRPVGSRELLLLRVPAHGLSGR